MSKRGCGMGVVLGDIRMLCIGVICLVRDTHAGHLTSKVCLLPSQSVVGRACDAVSRPGHVQSARYEGIMRVPPVVGREASTAGKAVALRHALATLARAIGLVMLDPVVAHL